MIAELMFLSLFGGAALVCALLAPLDWAVEAIAWTLARLSPRRRVDAWGNPVGWRWEALDR